MSLLLLTILSLRWQYHFLHYYYYCEHDDVVVLLRFQMEKVGTTNNSNSNDKNDHNSSNKSNRHNKQQQLLETYSLVSYLIVQYPVVCFLISNLSLSLSLSLLSVSCVCTFVCGIHFLNGNGRCGNLFALCAASPHSL